MDENEYLSAADESQTQGVTSSTSLAAQQQETIPVYTVDCSSFADDLLSPEEEVPHRRQFGVGHQNERGMELGVGMMSTVNQSLENILLDAVSMDESIDLGNGTSTAERYNLPETLSQGECSGIVVGEGVIYQDQMSYQASPVTTQESEVVSGVVLLNIDEENDGKRVGNDNDVAEHHETREADGAEAQDPGVCFKFVEANVSQGNESEQCHLQLQSSSHTPKAIEAETCEVSLTAAEACQQSTGVSAMATADSSRSLINFFTAAAATTAGADVEGKNFFDSFSTGNEEQEPQPVRTVSASPRISVTEQNPNFFIGPTMSTNNQMQEFHVEASSADAKDHVDGSVGNNVSTPGGHTRESLSHGAPGYNIQSLQTFDKQSGLALQFEGAMSPPIGECNWLGSVASQDGKIDVTEVAAINRCHDAWIPSETTQHAIAQAITSGGSLSPITICPSVLISDPLGDPVYDLVLRSMGEQEANKRLILTADSVPQDDVGLRQLIKCDCLRSAVDLSTRLLNALHAAALSMTSGTGSKVTLVPRSSGGQLRGGPVTISVMPYAMQLWFTRLSLMAKLRLYAQAETELEQFVNLDVPEFYYEFYPDIFPDRRGTMVPFEMRLLYAELPHWCSRTNDTLDRLCDLQSVVNKILSNLDSGLAEDGTAATFESASLTKSKELWRSRLVRVLYSTGNCFLNIKDYSSAIDIYKLLVVQDASNKVNLLSGLGRIYLQMGDLVTATQYFDLSESMLDPTTNTTRCQRVMNRALLTLGSNQFSEAYKLFKDVLDIDKNNVTAVNNMAVCCLYLGRLKSALQSLETLVYDDPRRHLQEPIVLNLCTLYELESSRASQKKQRLLSLISQHCGNGFNVACLKMS